ncbi:surface-adhesin E family protein [Phenylobacterium sp.]|uniref:surface-adhesin E family protein n=1 Tax=Phenylobacterium sp. TaxID=1871053 RepID=UPI002C929C5B|nr:surface-adhesin E family protein [Phenylobacterium sp.]HLZ73460.1 surface-adhesin E family protein [Phenylobacterium sp.]
MMHMRAAVLGGVISAALAGTGVCAPKPAAKPAAGDPPPPASLNVGDVEAWASAYIDADMWTLITHDLEGARFVRPEGGKAKGPHTIEADIRTELFKPVQMGAGLARSGLAHWSVDCAGTRYSVLSMTIYSHNNLQGELARKPAADADWITPNEFQVATIQVICKAVLSGKPLEPQLGAPPATPS